jgi:uncharacterized protein (DUF302 family)
MSEILSEVTLAIMRAEVSMIGTIAVEGMRVLPTKRTVDEALSRAEALGRVRGLTVFARIDFNGDAARVGLSMRPTGLVILGNPAAGTPIMNAAPTVAIDLPLKLLAWTDAEGCTWVAYNDPDCLRARHGFPTELTKNLAAFGSLAATVAAADP